MSKAADAFEQYLSTLSNEEWDALAKRVRPQTNVNELIQRVYSDPSVIASLDAEAQALQSAIDAFDVQILAAENATKAWLYEAGPNRDPAARPDQTLTIALKQERYRLQTALTAVQAEIKERTGK